MRELFVSERRYIRNMLMHHRKSEFSEFGKVLIEEYAPPRTRAKTRFNNDFALQFVHELTHFKSCCARVLPNTLGAEVFLTVDETTSRPLRTELLAGEAFPIRYFKNYIEIIEEKISRLSQQIQIRSCAYCRIFVIENDICFLAFPMENKPIVRGKRRILCSNSESLIEYSMDGNDIVYVDGWIGTSVVQTDKKLIASAK